MGIKEWNGKVVEMGRIKEQKITRMRSGSDKRALSQGSQGAKGAKEAKDLALGKAKLPRYQGAWQLLKFNI